jgi:hypothetical protein
MNHLVQQRMLDLGPGMSGYVAAADRDLDGVTGSEVHAQLAESDPHPSGEPDGQAPQAACEVLQVEPFVTLDQPVEEEQIPRPGPLAPARSGRRRGVLLDRKGEKLAFGPAPEGPGQPGIQEANDRL